MTVTYTLGQMTDDVARKARGTTRDVTNILAANLLVQSVNYIDTVTLTNAIDGLTSQALIVIDDETMKVLAVNETAQTVQVLRGYDDTTPAAHSTGTLVAVDPPWTRSTIQEFLRDELRSWGPQIYQVASVDLPIVQFQRGYDLSAITGTIIRVLKVTIPAPPYSGLLGTTYYQPSGAGQANMETDVSFDFDPNANTALFPSGKSLTLLNPSLPDVIGNIHVVYATPFDVDTSWTDSTDMIANVGLDSRDLDVPVIGALARLIRFMATRRAMTQVAGQNADAQVVTMPAILQAVASFEQTLASRKADIMQRQYADFPYTVSTY